MQSNIIHLDRVIDEGESFDLQVTFRDPSKAIIDASDFITILFYLYDQDTLVVINSVEAVNVKDAGPGTIDGSGILTIRIDGDDNIIVDATLAARKRERHIAKVVGTYHDGTSVRTIVEERTFDVVKLYDPISA